MAIIQHGLVHFILFILCFVDLAGTVALNSFVANNESNQSLDLRKIKKTLPKGSVRLSRNIHVVRVLCVWRDFWYSTTVLMKYKIERIAVKSVLKFQIHPMFFSLALGEVGSR